MSAVLVYREPHFFFAGALALLVHLAFFTPLYFATRWQSHPPEAFMVEMWDSLPITEVVPKQEPAPALPPPARMEPAPPAKVVAPVLPPVKADIEVRDKKSKKAEVKAKPAKKDDKKAKAVAKMARQEAEQRELAAYDANSEQRRQAVQAQVRAEVTAEMQTQIERYKDMMGGKIRRKMKAVADVPESAEAVFKITLLPDGTVMDAELYKSSGFSAYDEAAERAIRLASPLPMPTDVSLQKMFRELKLSIKP